MWGDPCGQLWKRVTSMSSQPESSQPESNAPAEPPGSTTEFTGWGRGAGAFAGVLATAAALAVAETLALILPGQPSIVIGIANRVIDLTPADVRESLISMVGTADKPLLSAGIITVVLVVGALVGMRLRNRAASAWPVFAGLGSVIAVLSMSSIEGLVWSLVAAVAGALAGWGVLALLLRTQVVVTATPDGVTTSRLEPGWSRRSFLVASGGVAVLAAGGIAVITATRAHTVRAVETARSMLRLPTPVKTAPPVPAGAAVDLRGMQPPVTPNADFYRIDTALVPPVVNVDDWRLSITGRVKQPLTLTYADLMAMPQVTQLVTLTCVSNPVGGDLVGNALWQGIPLRHLLDKVGLAPGADQLVAESVDGFTAAFPVDLAMDGREPMVAVGMNGEPLPVEHGYPARLVVPGLYGYVSATKWLTEIRLTTMAEETPFWVDRGWVLDGRIESASRIDVPNDQASVPAGLVSVAGRAWHQNHAIGSVEVSVDEGPWQRGTLADSMGIESWRLWSWHWQAPTGDHKLRVRMIDESGAVQSSQVREPGPAASSGYASISVEVT